MHKGLLSLLFVLTEIPPLSSAYFALGERRNNFHAAMKVAERLYADIYSSDVRGRNSSEPGTSDCEVPGVTKDEVEKLLKVTKRGKAAGDHRVSADMLKNAAGVVLGKLGKNIVRMSSERQAAIALQKGQHNYNSRKG